MPDRVKPSVVGRRRVLGCRRRSNGVHTVLAAVRNAVWSVPPTEASMRNRWEERGDERDDDGDRDRVRRYARGDADRADRTFHGRRACGAGQGCPGRGSAAVARRVGAATCSCRPGGAAGGAGEDEGGRARADPVRPDARLAVHVLSGCGVHDGGRSRRDAADGAARAALRRRAPVELRCLCGSRPAARVRQQRLRRDAAGPVRVGPEAAGRRASRWPAEAAGSTRPRARGINLDGHALVPRVDRRLRWHANIRSLVLARSTSRSTPAATRRR